MNRREKVRLADTYADEMMWKAMQMQERGESVGTMVWNIAWHYAMASKGENIKMWIEMHNASPTLPTESEG